MIDVLVPVLGRPESAKPLIDSITASATVPYRVLFLCSPNDDDQIESCRRTGAEVIIVDWEPEKADFARKINCGFRETEAPWVFQGADDVIFQQGWDKEALTVAWATGKSVIGTNDLHNPAVRSGNHSTHLLFSRAYIKEQGGTFDNSGEVFCELYDHQYVDNEFIETAKRRDEWAFAEKAIVEHIHPVWGLTAWDPTYEKAFRKTNQDRGLYNRRIRHMSRPR